MVWLIPTPSSAISYALKRTASFTHTPATTPPAYEEPANAQGQTTASTTASPEQVAERLIVARLKADAPEGPICTAQALLALQSSAEVYRTAASAQQLAFARELYLGALEVLLRGLPSEFTAAEVERLRSVLLVLQQHHPELAAAEAPEPAVSSGQVGPSTAMQTVLVLMCRTGARAVRFTVPKIKVGLEQAVAYEQRYHVLERSGIALTSTACHLAGTVARCQIGKLMSDLATALSLGAIEAYKVLAEENAVPASRQQAPMSSPR